jgi:hypothetical protein
MFVIGDGYEAAVESESPWGAKASRGLSSTGGLSAILSCLSPRLAIAQSLLLWARFWFTRRRLVATGGERESLLSPSKRQLREAVEKHDARPSLVIKADLESEGRRKRGSTALRRGGIGKSRLTAALLQEVSSEPPTCLQCFCSARHTDSALHPTISWMERAAGLAYNDTQQTKLDKLDELLTTATPIEDAELLADLVLRNDGRYRGLNLSAAQRQDRTLEALAKQSEAFARVDPVLIMFEDAHWADPTSLEALGQAVNRIATHRMPLIVTFRTGFAPHWIWQQHVIALPLDRLEPREVSAMIDRLVGDKSLAESVRTDIIKRMAGISLFVEQITKAVLEAESHVAAERVNAAISLPAPVVPASLNASLASHRMPLIFSSVPSCKTRLTAR